jgi:hypothetical protein
LSKTKLELMALEICKEELAMGAKSDTKERERRRFTDSFF